MHILPEHAMITGSKTDLQLTDVRKIKAREERVPFPDGGVIDEPECVAALFGEGLLRYVDYKACGVEDLVRFGMQLVAYEADAGEVAAESEAGWGCVDGEDRVGIQPRDPEDYGVGLGVMIDLAGSCGEGDGPGVIMISGEEVVED